MILASSADSRYFLDGLILAFPSADTVVLAVFAMLFAMILAFLSAAIALVSMIQAFLNAYIVFWT